jgi:molybdopterin molybdotransferase
MAGTMIHPDTAQDIIKTCITHEPEAEKILLERSLGRILAYTVCSPLDSPPFDKSAMDGYAVSAADNSPSYKILETIAAGDKPTMTVSAGECCKIMTGAMMPAGADKVIRVEYTEERDGFMVPVREEPQHNVIKKAENLRAGDPVLSPRALKAQDIGILASLGLDRVDVAVPPLVGIITTGSELRNPGEKLGSGEIYNSNGPQLCSQVVSAHCPFKYYGVVEDDPASLSGIVKRASEECNVIILSGGVSMGEFDFVPEALTDNSFRIDFHMVAVKPGKPTLFARKGEQYAFGLPGNPVSTFIIFEVFVKTLLYRMMGIKNEPAYIKAILAEEIKRRDSERVEFRPVRMEGNRVYPLPYYGSSHLNALASAAGLIRIEQDVNFLEKGTGVDVRQI